MSNALSKVDHANPQIYIELVASLCNQRHRNQVIYGAEALPVCGLVNRLPTNDRTAEAAT
eukprot:5858020-Pyramimonas_sp.AAC.1